jgi:hypothetical protein
VEAAAGLREYWTDDTGTYNARNEKSYLDRFSKLILSTLLQEWHSLPLHQSVLRTIAKQSSRVFQGAPLCYNPDWLRITVNHTVTFFEAAESLKVWPHLLRPLAAKVLPLCRKLRAEAQEARRIIAPVLEERLERARARMAQEDNSDTKVTGLEGKEEGDGHSDGDGEGNMIEWAEETAKGAIYDAALLQMKVSLASIHTTSDLVTQTLFNLSSRPELVDDLRKEVIEVIGQQGWVKPALYQLKLMDSVLKETQRLKPISIGTNFPNS